MENKISFEDLKNYKGFDEIDRKVGFIEANRGCTQYCEQTIRELNKNIDLDYVKQSENMEYTTNHELQDFVIDDNVKILRSEPRLPIDELLNAKTNEEYYEILDKLYDNSSIILLKNEGNNKFNAKYIKNPKHLVTLDVALRRARKDRRALKEGLKPELESDFIEEINEMLFSDLLENGPTAGFGRYRSRVYRYGCFEEINVRVSDAAFQTTPGAQVWDEMHDLVDFYNNSDLHPVLKALVFKTRFIKIHPFSDFNGRTSRILLNYMLVRYGYPTVTIKGKHKDRYLQAMDDAIVNDNYYGLIKIVKDLLNARCDKYISIIHEHMQMSGLNIGEDF